MITNKINVVSFLLKKPEIKSYNASFVHFIKVKTGRVVFFRFRFCSTDNESLLESRTNETEKLKNENR